MDLTRGVTIVIPSTGPEYTDLAHARAIPSAQATAADAVIEVIAPTLQAARNEGLARVRTEWTVFLDADDELPADYLDGLDAAGPWDAPVDVWVPPVEYVHNGRVAPARFLHVSGHGSPHECGQQCLYNGNYVVIGAPVRTAVAVAAGGFRDFAWSEDWDFWLRIHLYGGRFAVGAWMSPYRAHVRPGSRNKLGRADHLRHHNAILRANGLPEV